ncbi:hypothetical protein CCS41_12310 [Candidatus Fukatsuia symbiotica]|uniref:Uncharacterized protein n=1 Tax=Candidatus Fukatsuia symbiotica TaxID=1878942 RepID=A0A2U8I7I0_9GAMM|nr:hypothetical protein CCS41_12310 [Candidatus Fukatsuia symbiotica]
MHENKAPTHPYQSSDNSSPAPKYPANRFSVAPMLDWLGLINNKINILNGYGVLIGVKNHIVILFTVFKFFFGFFSAFVNKSC